MICVGTGGNHEMLEDIAFNSLGHLREGEGAGTTVTKAAPQYTGGDLRLKRQLDDGQVHMGLAFETENWHSKDLMAMCVLNMMMGGGGSFSAGGPGKGMYTRLYTRVLNRYHWMYSATAYNHAYNDSGIFCIHASCHPQQLQELTQVLIREFVAITGEISDEELSRAKTQLKSMLLMNLESRPVIFEDCARQVLSVGHRRKPEYFISLIDQVTR